MDLDHPSQRLARDIALAVLLIATCVLVGGWMAGYEPLRRFIPGLPDMKVNTSLSLILFGCALLMLADGRPRMLVGARVLGMLVVALGLLILGEYAFSVNLGIDQLLFKDPSRHFPGRPSQYTAAALICLGFSFATFRSSGRRAKLHSAANTGAGVLVIAGLVGYVYGIDYLRGISHVTGVAPPTLFALALSTIGVVCLAPERGLLGRMQGSEPGARMARWCFPLALLAPLPLGALCYWAEEGLGLFDPRVGVATDTLAIMAVLSIGVFAAAARLTRADREIAWLAELVRSSTDAIIGVTSEGKIASWNVGAERLYGYSATEATGQSTSMLLAAGSEDDLQGLLERMRAGEDIESYEAVRSHKDGSAFDVSLTVSPLRDRAGRLTGVSMIARDITAHKRLERGVAVARDEALQALREKSEFVANMSHEIRTPLNGVIGMAELLRDTPLEPIQVGYVDALSASGRALRSVISDVLDFSKIDAGHMKLDPADFELRGVVEEACLLVAAPARAKGLRIDHAVEPGVPLAINGDRDRLRQILLNLLSNAVKFTAYGEIGVMVCTDVGDQLRFVVTDTGIGIEQDDVARLFEPFVQADQSTTRRYGGTGLGLTISRELAHSMGGEVGAAPRAGGGSMFWFTASLPAVVADLGQLERRTDRRLRRERRAPEQEISVRGPAVLIAEDNEINRTVAKALLGRRGLRTVTAHDGLQAVAMAAANDYLAIFMDCQMPELDGYEATRRIRAAENGRHVPIIAMTAHSMRGDRARCLASGMDDYLSKPVRGEALDAVLAQWLPRVHEGQPTGTAIEDANSERSGPATSAGGSLSPATVLHLHDELSAEMRESLLKTFEESLSQCLTDIEEAVAHADHAGVRRIAHLLGGSSATLGATDLRLICKRLELTAGGEGTAPEAGQLVQLHAMAGAARKALREQLL